MKKTYMKPVMKSVELDYESLIASSPENQHIDYGGEDNGQGAAEARGRGSIWDADL